MGHKKNPKITLTQHKNPPIHPQRLKFLINPNNPKIKINPNRK
jgi:hypothetical protein